MARRSGTVKIHGSQFHKNPALKRARIHPNVNSVASAMRMNAPLPTTKFTQPFPRIIGA